MEMFRKNNWAFSEKTQNDAYFSKTKKKLFFFEETGIRALSTEISIKWHLLIFREMSQLRTYMLLPNAELASSPKSKFYTRLFLLISLNTYNFDIFLSN